MEVPAVDPNTTPVGRTVTLALLADHTPPGAGSVSVMDVPPQTFDGPDMVPALGNGLTVTVVNAIQLVGSVYTTMVVPAVSPARIPVPTPMVPVVILLLLHVPPGVASVRWMVEPTHTLLGPAIGAGAGSTIIE